jgi:hypothetical protein
MGPALLAVIQLRAWDHAAVQAPSQLALTKFSAMDITLGTEPSKAGGVASQAKG